MIDLRSNHITSAKFATSAKYLGWGFHVGGDLRTNHITRAKCATSAKFWVRDFMLGGRLANESYYSREVRDVREVLG